MSHIDSGWSNEFIANSWFNDWPPPAIIGARAGGSPWDTAHIVGQRINEVRARFTGTRCIVSVVLSKLFVRMYLQMMEIVMWGLTDCNKMLRFYSVQSRHNFLEG